MDEAEVEIEKYMPRQLENLYSTFPITKQEKRMKDLNKINDLEYKEVHSLYITTKNINEFIIKKE